MTMTWMQGHSGSAVAQKSAWNALLSATDLAMNIKHVTTVGQCWDFYVTLTLQTFVLLDQLVFLCVFSRIPDAGYERNCELLPGVVHYAAHLIQSSLEPVEMCRCL